MALWGKKGAAGSQPPRTRSISAVDFIAACCTCLAIGFFVGDMTFYRSCSKQYVHHKGADTSVTPVTSAPVAQLQQGALQPICLNTCKKARDGICDDGRGKNGTSKYVFAECDLGTDCDDCGPWTPSGPAPWADGKTAGPVSRLRAQGIEVRVQMSTAPTPFLFAYTNPEMDFDVSGWMHNVGGVEFALTKVARSIFHHRCVTPTTLELSKRKLFVDVGANFGWFSVLAATMGCRVVAFEPVPHFNAFLEYNLHLANVSHMVTVHSKAVGHEAGKEVEMKVPSKGIWGTASVGGLNIDKAIPGMTMTTLRVPTTTLDEVVKEDVLLLKVDVEGWEWSVMAGAKQLLSTRSVDNILLEYSPGVPERNFLYNDILRSILMLVDLIDGGYRVAHVGEDKYGPRPNFFLEPIPTMEEVTIDNLRYDVKDAIDLKTARLGCPVDKALCKFPSWRCNGVPENLNPRSLRAAISHNTNLWLARGQEPTSSMPLNGTVGVLKLDDPPTKFFVDGKTGMAGRVCTDMARTPQYMIKSRCPCTDAKVCGEEEAVAKEVAARSAIVENYVLPLPAGVTANRQPEQLAQRNAALAKLLRTQIHEGFNTTEQSRFIDLSGCPKA